MDVLPGRHPKWLSGSRLCFPANFVRSSAMHADRIFAIVSRRAIGRYALGSAYDGLAGLGITSVIEFLHSHRYVCRSKVARNIGPRIGTSMSAHFFSTILGIPLAPGALYGLVLFMALSIWASVMFLKAKAGSG